MKCKVCGKRFPLLAKNRYVVRAETVLPRRTGYYNAFDCPRCGCQNIAGVVEMDVVENKEAGDER